MSGELSIYNDFKIDGFELVVRFNGDVGDWTPEAESYDGIEVDTDFNTYGVMTNFNTADIDGTTIQQNDFKLFFPTYGTNLANELVLMDEVTPLNKILIDGVEQNIVSITPTRPANSILLYVAHVRK